MAVMMIPMRWTGCMIDLLPPLTPALLLLLVPLPALAAFVALGLGPTRLPRGLVRTISLAGGLLPLLVLAPLAYAVLADGWRPLVPIFTLHVGPWPIDLALRLDAFSAIVSMVVTAIGAAVFSFSMDYLASAAMAELRRFFALMNLFLTAMLTMVMAGDSITLFLGWELMGLCSFFLIASKVTSRKAVAAGRKAFLITRVADAALLAALLLLFLEAASVRLDRLVVAGLAAPDERRAIIAALMLVGAAGKSAQFPFHSWLPSAMAGPTPVSALLHSATMVAAGAVLLAQFSPLIASVPQVALATAIIGGGTALFAATQAIMEPDLKRLLAWSSVSQIGYMFLAIGVGAPAAGIAHFTVHAIFKSLLFLSAGDMARAAGGDTSVAAVAGMRRTRPLAFFAFAAGAASLAGLPLISAGFWSKEAVLGSAFAGDDAARILWAVALLAAMFTAAYALRPVARGLAPAVREPAHAPAGLFTRLPLALLGAGSIIGGLLVAPVMRALGSEVPHVPPLPLALAIAAPLAGFAISARLLARPSVAARLDRLRRAERRWSVDALIVIGIARPFARLVRILTGRRGRPGDPVGALLPGLLAGLRDTLVGRLAHDPLDRLLMTVVGSVRPAAAGLAQRQPISLRSQSSGLALAMLLIVLMTVGGALWA